MESYRVAFLQSDNIYGRGLKNLLISHNLISEVDIYSSVSQLLSSHKKYRVVIVDLDEYIDGIKRTLINIRKQLNDSKILGIGYQRFDHKIFEVISSGIHGIVYKSEPFEVLIDAIRKLIENKKRIPEKIANQLMMNFENLHKSLRKDTLNKLTKREIQVLRFSCLDLSNQQIADVLFISRRTVEGHRTNISEKIGTTSPISQLIFALRNGYITLEEVFASKRKTPRNGIEIMPMIR